MINHVSTLLLNKPAGTYTGVDGAIYIPDGFAPVQWPLALRRLHEVLVPPGMDPYADIDVVKQFLPLVHAPDFLDLVSALDTRITYDTGNANEATLLRPRVGVTAVKSASCDMTPKYKWVAGATAPTPQAAGNYRWDFTAATPTTSRLRGSRSTDAVVTMIDGSVSDKSLEIVLVPDRLWAWFDVPSSVLTGDYRFTYTAILLPGHDMAQVMADTMTVLRDHNTASQLFQSFVPAQAQMAELQYIWQTAQEPVMRFTAAILALVYQGTRLLVPKA